MQKSKQNKCFHLPLTNMKQMKTKALEPTQTAVEKNNLEKHNHITPREKPHLHKKPIFLKHQANKKTGMKNRK